MVTRKVLTKHKNTFFVVQLLMWLGPYKSIIRDTNTRTAAGRDDTWLLLPTDGVIELSKT